MYAVPRLRSGLTPPGNADPEHPGMTVVVADTFEPLVLAPLRESKSTPGRGHP
jgi:hypothetical protein